MELFQGYNTFSGESLSTVVNGTAVPGNLGGGLISEITFCKDTEDVFNALEVDASVSASYGVFSAEAKSKFVQSMHLTTNSVTVIVHVSPYKGWGYSKAYIADDVLKTLNTQEGRASFINQYGDSFVSSVKKGSAYYAALVFYSETLEQKLSVEAGFKASGVIGGVTLSADLKTKVENATQSSKVQWSIFQSYEGFSPGSIHLPEPDPDKIIQFALDFPSMKPDAEVTLNIEVQGYEKLVPASVDLSGLIANRRLFNGTATNDGWGRWYQNLVELKNLCQQIKNLYTFYGGFADPDFEAKRTQIQNDIVALESFFYTLQDNPLTARKFNQPVSLNYGSPAATYDLITAAGGGGGAGGTFFSDITPDQIAQRVRISQLQVSCGDRIDMFTVTYETATGMVDSNGEVVGDLNTWTVNHGTPGGTPGAPISLNASPIPEQVSEIDAWAAWDGWHVMNRLNITTNRGQQIITYPNPPGDQKPTVIWPDVPGTTNVLVGFAGSANGDLIFLKPMLLKLKPVSWVSWAALRQVIIKAQ